MSLAAGDLIGGKYRVVRLIGDGGMGTVYEARHELLGIPVALKFLHADLAKRPGLAARFMQEARVSATIQSPHVTHVTDVDTSPDGSPFLVMELLSGESLQAFLNRQGKLPAGQAVEFALQILAGLEAAHALGVVHRDLKPDNVFVTISGGRALLKLIDFGIAKLRETSEFKKELTRAGVVMGTPEYMAPEQLYAANAVDLRADIYSLGVMLFEMLAGTRPADGDSAEAIVASVMSGNVRQLATLEPSLPLELVQVVERAMAREREQRFPSSQEMRAALIPFASGVAQAGQPPAPAHQSNVANTLDGEGSAAGIPRTLPPEAPGPRPGGTQAAGGGVPAAWQPAAVAARALPAAMAKPQLKKRNNGWIWGLLFVCVAGLAVGGWFASQSLLGARQAIPQLPPLETLPPVPSGAITIEPLGTSPTPTNAPVGVSRPPPAVGAAGTTPHAHPSASTTPSTSLPGNAGGNAATSPFPLPFPSFALPSSLPPLPSGLPTTLPTSLPTTLPTTLPSFLPQIPGLTLPPAAPKSSAR